MIRSFRCRETEKIFRREFSRKFPGDIQERAFMKLNAIDAAVEIQDLRFPPSNRLEALKGNRKGQWSIRINNQWRICFEWLDGHAEDVAIEDYHYRRCGMVKKRIPPVHPGAYLKELLDELGLSQYRLAKDIAVPAMRVSYVVKGKRPITAELALRLGRYFGQNPRYWLNLQSRYDMDIVEDTLSDQVARQVRPRAIAVS